MSDYDSGDDLFDGQDAEAVLHSSQVPPPSKPLSVLAQNVVPVSRTKFENVGATKIFRSKPAMPPLKRRLEDSIKAEPCEGGSFGEELFDEEAFEQIAVVKKPRIKIEVDDEVVQDLARGILRSKFGFSAFRLEQETAVTRLLQGKNAMVIFPTGGGKSLCYQVPGIAFEELDKLFGLRGHGDHGVTLVVSPLLALMKDQVDVLQRKGIAAESIDSTKSWDKQQAINSSLRNGKLRLLYCAPERLNNEGFVEIMKQIPGGVRLVAVDEAHCISEWGHQFRPDYLKVARFVQEIKAERAICLTATATSRVVDDVCKTFDIDKADVFRTSPYRKNLQLLAKVVPKADGKFELLCDFLSKHPGPTLVYVSTQAQTISLAAQLRRKKFNALPFHAGMNTEEKMGNQDKFMADEVNIIVATIAFGMGIDKANIRNIVHYGIPGSVEEYSQQVGRAGRDGAPSTCMFFVCPEDLDIRACFAHGDTPSRTSLLGLLADIFSPDVTSLPVDGVFKRSQAAQSKDFDIRANPLSVIYATLELRFGLIRAITPEYGDYKFTATPQYVRTMQASKSKVDKAIFEHGILKKVLYHIDVNLAARAMGLNRQEVTRRLNEMNDRGIIQLRTSGIENRYRVLTDKLPDTAAALEELAKELHADLEAREEEAIRRTDQVLEMITGRKCFALALAHHFNMDLPDGMMKCGHCSFCLDGRPLVLPPSPPKPLDLGLVMRVLEVCSARDDARFLARLASGIYSPRVGQLKLGKSEVFGSMEGYDFKALVKEFSKACTGVDHPTLC